MKYNAGMFRGLLFLSVLSINQLSNKLSRSDEQYNKKNSWDKHLSIKKYLYNQEKTLRTRHSNVHGFKNNIINNYHSYTVSSSSNLFIDMMMKLIPSKLSDVSMVMALYTGTFNKLTQKSTSTYIGVNLRFIS